MQFRIYTPDERLTGLEGIAYEREQQRSIATTLTDDYIANIIREYQLHFENPDNVGFDGQERFLIGDAYWNFESPHRLLLTMIARNYGSPGEFPGLNILLDMDTESGVDFYRVRSERMEELLNAEYRNLTEQQKEFWRNMDSNVTTPFQFGYYGGWSVITSSFELLIFALLAICIVLAHVFAGEYQAGTDSVILSGKYGKTKLITAKIISSFIFGVCAFTVNVIVAFGIPLLAFGSDGWNLPIQLANPAIPFAFTFLQGTLVNLAVIYFVVLAMIGVTLLLSAKMKSPYLAFIVILPVLFVPLFLTPTGTTGLYNLILFLTPYRATMPQFGSYISYQFGGLVLDALSMRVILYLLITVITIPLARMGFRKHQVS
jgi:ABC-type transport system involved in multi-copper enzyme maturation permease subunit